MRASRIPVYSKSEKSEAGRVPDTRIRLVILTSPSVRCLWQGFDGIQNRIHPGDPLDKDLYDLEPEELADIESTPVFSR